MNKIIDLRLSSPDKQKALCVQLLRWASENNDTYAAAFANVYLAFYFTGQNNVNAAGACLFRANKLLANYKKPCEELLLRLHKQLGVYYVMQGNEQGAIQSNLRAIDLAQKTQDKQSECVACSNLGFAFERHSSFDEATGYFERAYELIKDEPYCDLHIYILANLMVSALFQKRYDDAKLYMQKSIDLPYDTELRDIYAKRNECCYYAAIGDREKALECAAYIKMHEEQCGEGHIAAFENYMLLFDGMMNIDSEEHAQYFLNKMSITHGEILHQRHVLEDRRVQLALKYGSEQEKQLALREYFTATSCLQELSNRAIIDAVKAKMHLDEFLKGNKELYGVQSKLERQIEKDELTGLYNRRFLDKLVEQRSQAPNKELFGIVMIDIDYFKEYNDYYGHIQGDKALKAVARCLKECSTEKISACRFGGDEFICLCDGASAQEIEDFVTNTRTKLNALALPHEKSHCCAFVTISIGYAYEKALFTASPYMMLELADKALYEAKLAGRNSFVRKRADDNE